MPNLNRTRTGPQVRFGVQQILDFAGPVRTCMYMFEPMAKMGLFDSIKHINGGHFT
jgi:hypothetical protein